VDGGRARIILHVPVTPADVTEHEPTLDLLRRVAFRWRLHPERATADRVPSGRYGTLENIRALEDAGIRAYVPLPDVDGRTPYYGASAFTYDAERDECRRPQGQPLARHSRQSAEEVVTDRADAAICNACPVKAACTASERVPSGWHGAPLVLRGLSRARPGLPRHAGLSKSDAQAQAPRGHPPEPLFAEAKSGSGYASSARAGGRRSTSRRSRWRPART